MKINHFIDGKPVTHEQFLAQLNKLVDEEGFYKSIEEIAKNKELTIKTTKFKVEFIY